MNLYFTISAVGIAIVLTVISTLVDGTHGSWTVAVLLAGLLICIGLRYAAEPFFDEDHLAGAQRSLWLALLLVLLPVVLCVCTRYQGNTSIWVVSGKVPAQRTLVFCTPFYHPTVIRVPSSVAVPVPGTCHTFPAYTDERGVTIKNLSVRRMNTPLQIKLTAPDVQQLLDQGLTPGEIPAYFTEAIQVLLHDEYFSSEPQT